MSEPKRRRAKPVAVQRLRLMMIVNGVAQEIEVRDDAPMTHAVAVALHLTKNVGRSVSEWELRDATGVLFDQSRSAASLEIVDGATLYLNPNAGIGGSAAPAVPREGAREAPTPRAFIVDVFGKAGIDASICGGTGKLTWDDARELLVFAFRLRRGKTGPGAALSPSVAPAAAEAAGDKLDATDVQVIRAAQHAAPEGSALRAHLSETFRRVERAALAMQEAAEFTGDAAEAAELAPSVAPAPKEIQDALAWLNDDDASGGRYHQAERETCRRALAAVAPAGTPVAWRYRFRFENDTLGPWHYVDRIEHVPAEGVGVIHEPLYAAVAALPREPHPDTERLDWLTQQLGDAADIGLSSWGDRVSILYGARSVKTQGDAEFTAEGKSLRAAIDAARSSAPREGT